MSVSVLLLVVFGLRDPLVELSPIVHLSDALDLGVLEALPNCPILQTHMYYYWLDELQNAR